MKYLYAQNDNRFRCDRWKLCARIISSSFPSLKRDRIHKKVEVFEEEHQRSIGSKREFLYGRAIKSIRKYEFPIRSGAQAQSLPSEKLYVLSHPVGPYLGRRIDSILKSRAGRSTSFEDVTTPKVSRKNGARFSHPAQQQSYGRVCPTNQIRIELEKAHQRKDYRACLELEEHLNVLLAQQRSRSSRSAPICVQSSSKQDSCESDQGGEVIGLGGYDSEGTVRVPPAIAKLKVDEIKQHLRILSEKLSGNKHNLQIRLTMALEKPTNKSYRRKIIPDDRRGHSEMRSRAYGDGKSRDSQTLAS
eukprot:jgi/Bigna1/137505/aug1.39_g12213